MGLFDGTLLERPVLCDACGRQLAECDCPPLDQRYVDPQSQTLTIAVEKRKRQKVVTLVSGFSCPESQVRELLTVLKNACGAGGSVGPGGLLEIQGNHAAELKKHLKSHGYRVAS